MSIGLSLRPADGVKHCRFHLGISHATKLARRCGSLARASGSIRICARGLATSGRIAIANICILDRQRNWPPLPSSTPLRSGAADIGEVHLGVRAAMADEPLAEGLAKWRAKPPNTVLKVAE